MFSRDPIKRGENPPIFLPPAELGDGPAHDLSKLDVKSQNKLSIVVQTPQFKFEVIPLLSAAGVVGSQLQMERRFKDGRLRDSMTISRLPRDLEQIIFSEAIQTNLAPDLASRVAYRAEQAGIQVPEGTYRRPPEENPLFIAGNGLVTRSFRDEHAPNFNSYVNNDLVSQVHLEQERRLEGYDGVKAYLKIDVREDGSGRQHAEVKIAFSDQRTTAWEGVLRSIPDSFSVAESNGVLANQVQDVIDKFVHLGADTTVAALRRQHDERYSTALIMEHGVTGINGWLVQNETHYSLIFVSGSDADRLTFSVPKSKFPMAPQVLVELLHLITNGSQGDVRALGSDQLHGLMHLHALGASITPAHPRVYHNQLQAVVGPVVDELPEGVVWRPLTDGSGIDAELATLQRIERGELVVSGRRSHEPSRLLIGVDPSGACSLTVTNALGHKGCFRLETLQAQIGSEQVLQKRIQSVLRLFLSDPTTLIPELKSQSLTESNSFPPVYDSTALESFALAGQVFEKIALKEGVEVHQLMHDVFHQFEHHGGSRFVATVAQSPNLIVTFGIVSGQVSDLSFQFKKESLWRRLGGAAQEVRFILPFQHDYTIEELFQLIEDVEPTSVGSDFVSSDQFIELSEIARSTHVRSWWSRARDVALRSLFAW